MCLYMADFRICDFQFCFNFLKMKPVSSKQKVPMTSKCKEKENSEFFCYKYYRCITKLHSVSQVWVRALRLWILFLRKFFFHSVEWLMLSLFHLSLQWWLGRQVRRDRRVSAWSCRWNNNQAPVSWCEMVWWLLPTASTRNQSPKSMVSGILAAQVPVPVRRVSSREP